MQPEKNHRGVRPGKGASLPDMIKRGEILRVEAGSTVHGVGIEGTDDRDEMGITLEDPQFLLGLDSWPETYVYRTQPNGHRSGPGDLDLVVHGLRKFARLAAAGNPTIIQALFVPDSAIVYANATGRKLMALSDRFVSKRAGAAYLGYLRAQRMRLTGERGQKDVNRPELVKRYGYDTKFAMHAMRLGLQGIELMQTGSVTLPCAERDFLLGVRTGKLTYDQAVAKALSLEAELAAAMESSLLPPRADMPSIDAFLIEAHREFWGW